MTNDQGMTNDQAPMAEAGRASLEHPPSPGATGQPALGPRRSAVNASWSLELGHYMGIGHWSLVMLLDGRHPANAPTSTLPRSNASTLRRWFVLALLTLFTAGFLHAENLASLFDQANKLYEQAKYDGAANAYQKLVQSEPASAALYFNLGNAWFKAGQSGRAIAAYRQAERLAPRDPNLRFNLNFVRKKVTGAESAPAESWRRWLATLTLNEWTALAMGASWLWFLLLALRELRPTLRRTLSGYTTTAGVAAILLGAILASALYDQSRVKQAVIIATNAVIRYGPLEESQVFYQLRDGSEVTVLDEKELSLGGKSQTWLQVQDALHRIGWVQRDQVILLSNAPGAKPIQQLLSSAAVNH